VRYSGAPLAYSFSEHAHTKGSWLVDLGAGGAVAATFVDAPVPRPLARLRGTLEDLLDDPSLTAYESSWVHATLTDTTRPVQPMERLRRRFPHALVLAFEPAERDDPVVPTARPGVRSDHDISLDFVRELRGAAATEAESALLRQACDACCEDTDVDVLLTTSGGR
jgi:DNA repair protein SbcD/Mre11